MPGRTLALLIPLSKICWHVQWTIAVENTRKDYPCFIVPDLSEDSRFANLPIVNGTLASFRFYAGTPITTEHGVNIGALFMFDDKPRPEGLTFMEKKRA